VPGQLIEGRGKYMRKDRKAWDDDLEMPPLTKAQLRTARKPTPEEQRMFSEALANFRKKGRPAKSFGKYRPVTIRLHPYVLAWAKAEAKRHGIGYQTFINRTLLNQAA
jgi:uncharacterized protein (DUF4415 family)